MPTRGRVLPKRKAAVKAASKRPRAKGTWGGARPGAGRKPKGERAGTPHRARRHQPKQPVLVTLRAHFPLRTAELFPAIRKALADSTRRDPGRFRIVHFSVKDAHLFLIVEAKNTLALSSGMRSVSIGVALNVNSALQRATGKLWADRWQGRALGSPREVREALVSVLAGFRKDAPRKLPPGIDPFSSAAWFDGFRSEAGRVPHVGRPIPSPDERVPVSPARTPLLASGWRKLGLIGLNEAP